MENIEIHNFCGFRIIIFGFRLLRSMPIKWAVNKRILLFPRVRNNIGLSYSLFIFQTRRCRENVEC